VDGRLQWRRLRARIRQRVADSNAALFGGKVQRSDARSARGIGNEDERLRLIKLFAGWMTRLR